MSPSNEAVLLLTPGNGVNRTIQDMGRLEQDRAVLPALETKGVLRLRILMTVTKKNKSVPMEPDKTLVALFFFYFSHTRFAAGPVLAAGEAPRPRVSGTMLTEAVSKESLTEAVPLEHGHIWLSCYGIHRER